MRKLFAMLVIGLGLVVGLGSGSESVAYDDCKITNEIYGLVEYQTDGDRITIYSDDSSILVNYQKDLYIMWLPETEDYEYCYNSEEELMNAIEKYHGHVNDDNLQYPEATTMNPMGYNVVENELNKVEDDVLELLESSGLEIIYSSDIIEEHEERVGTSEGYMVLGYYVPNNNYIVMRGDHRSIKGALLHEIGHALDFNLGLRYNETLIDSYMEGEVEFTDNADYYYSSIEEYIAESIEYYYNDLLPKDTDIYQELDYILGE